MPSVEHVATPRPDAWRALLSDEEMAAFDSGKYRNPKTAPRDSDWLSRNKRLVSLTDKAVARVYSPTPEDQARLAEYTRALKVIAAIPYHCVICKRLLPGWGEDRVAVLTYQRSEEIPQRAFIYCRLCFESLGLTLEQPSWFGQLPELDQKIWQLLAEGNTQAEVAARLTKGTQRVTQQQVSEAKERVVRKSRELRDRRPQNEQGQSLSIAGSGEKPPFATIRALLADS